MCNVHFGLMGERDGHKTYRYSWAVDRALRLRRTLTLPAKQVYRGSSANSADCVHLFQVHGSRCRGTRFYVHITFAAPPWLTYEIALPVQVGQSIRRSAWLYALCGSKHGCRHVAAQQGDSIQSVSFSLS